ncbi:hypothetical protein E2986_07099 [Frieseomelitta varia]|uniref:G patch domain-containing protein 4 n=1 Tax=Frieseomelitta varia TaxID=561572 RepID=A0A833RZL0_9HYME|nr:hypothetical protein E2986_07099 [Frieseomelitta varia]
MSKGLGKHENGITEALKPKLKFDTAGLGYKDKKLNNWWEHTFNKAANSIKVVPKADGVSIFISKENATNDLKEDLTKKESEYGNFHKSFTLFNDNVLIKDNSNAYEEQDTEKNINHVPLTDEELFKICDGRTIHYGARHGLTLNGKLKRIAQQDKYLSTDSYINTSKLQNSIMLHDDEYEEINNENMLSMTSPKNEIASKVDKTITKRDRKRMNDLSHQLNVLCNISDSNEKNIHTIMKKKLGQGNKQKYKEKRRREKKSSIYYDTESFEEDKIDNISNYPTVSPSKSIRNKLIKEYLQNVVNDHMENKHIDIKKKKRRNKRFRKEKNEINEHENITNKWEGDDPHGSQPKKFKRSHKTDLDINLVKNKDIKIEDKFQAEFSGNEVPVKSNDVTCPPVNVAESLSEKSNKHFKKKVDDLNAKIKKKKLHKKKKTELSKITKSLEAIHLEKSVKQRNIKNELKAVTRNMMMMNVTVDKTEVLKQKKIKTKKLNS